MLETPASFAGTSKFKSESENRRMALSHGYTGRTTPVNVHGKPITDLSKTGGLIAALFIFGNQMAERMAYFSLPVNMVTFMLYVMHKSFTDSSNAVNNFLGISQASSVLGGFSLLSILQYEVIFIDFCQLGWQQEL
ncbi:Protein NRT1/ PTR FAMILY 6.1 [Melia azedarach]|uniref:Protein NRT1/ PTR FAMILY 6.1 n=1 Tax=Melia azedarach TaxID=155640 RepID=A0ACC1YCT7_MELAZ|nr:Protein NRT1/ PTR FAMILY 6.1 [Melia azedarach]